MKPFNWNFKKNNKQKNGRGISFEVIVWWIENNGLIEIIDNPNKKRYPKQRIFIVNVEEYVHLVPFIESDTRNISKNNNSQQNSYKELFRRQNNEIR